MPKNFSLPTISSITQKCDDVNLSVSDDIESVYIKLYPELGYSAKTVKETKELFFWYQLHTLLKLHNHAGFIPSYEAAADFQRLFKYSYATFRRILHKGDGIYWHEFFNVRRNTKYIEVYGLGRICIHLNIAPTQRPVFIKAKDAIGRKSKNAWIYGAFGKPSGTTSKYMHPIMRKAVEKITHVKVRTQQRYDKVLKTDKVSHSAVDCNGKPEMVTYKGRYKTYQVQKMFGNSYVSNSYKGTYGILHWMNNMCNVIPKYAPFCHLPRKAGGLEIMRKFFNTAKAYTHCKKPKALKCYVRDYTSDNHMTWKIA